jgi:hypothetical protein
MQQRDRFKFILTELELGNAFATIALNNADNPEKREPNERSAREGYEQATRFIKETQLALEEREKLAAGMAKLRAALNL